MRLEVSRHHDGLLSGNWVTTNDPVVTIKPNNKINSKYAALPGKSPLATCSQEALPLFAQSQQYSCSTIGLLLEWSAPGVHIWKSANATKHIIETNDPKNPMTSYNTFSYSWSSCFMIWVTWVIACPMAMVWMSGLMYLKDTSKFGIFPMVSSIFWCPWHAGTQTEFADPCSLQWRRHLFPCQLLTLRYTWRSYAEIRSPRTSIPIDRLLDDDWQTKVRIFQIIQSYPINLTSMLW